MSDSKYKNFLKSKITKEDINVKEAQRLGHFAELGKLNSKELRSKRTISIVKTPTGNKLIPINEEPNQTKTLSRIRPEENPIFKSLSFEDISDQLSDNSIIIMSAFSIADFNRVIPEYKGDATQLSVFLKRCDTFHDSLNDAGKVLFLSHMIFKLAGKAFLIYENKIYNDWPELKADLLEGLKVSKSTSALQNELVNLKQSASQSAKEFSDIIKEKLKELSDIITTQYSHAEVIKSFKIEYDKIAIRAFKEGLRAPLKYRIVNFEPKSLDEIIRKAVEEEPYVNVLKSSLDSNTSNSEKLDSFKTQVEDDWRKSRNNLQNSQKFQNNQQFNRFNNNRRSWQSNQNFATIRPQNSLSWNNNMQRQQDYGRNRYTNNGNNADINNNENQPRNQQYSRDHLFCLRCERHGHTSDRCYARLNNVTKIQPSDSEEVSKRLQQVSFLEVPQSRRPILGPNKTSWSNKTPNH